MACALFDGSTPGPSPKHLPQKLPPQIAPGGPVSYLRKKTSLCAGSFDTQHNGKPAAEGSVPTWIPAAESAGPQIREGPSAQYPVLLASKIGRRFPASLPHTTLSRVSHGHVRRLPDSGAYAATRPSAYPKTGSSALSPVMHGPERRPNPFRRAAAGSFPVHEIFRSDDRARPQGA